MKSIFAPRAQLDLIEIWLFIANDSIDAADRIKAEIIATVEMLEKFPHSGRQRNEIATGVRSFPIGRYLIFYRATIELLEVARIIHGARDLKSAFEE